MLSRAPVSAQLAVMRLSRSLRSRPFDLHPTRPSTLYHISRPVTSTLPSHNRRMASLTILTASDVNQIIQDLDLDAAIRSQASVFQAYSANHPAVDGVEPIQTPQRLAIQSSQTTTLYMPARIEGAQAACKIVAIPKKGGADGLPATTLVVDDEGRVKGVVNARQLTALRNACGTSIYSWWLIL